MTSTKRKLWHRFLCWLGHAYRFEDGVCYGGHARGNYAAHLQHVWCIRPGCDANKAAISNYELVKRRHAVIVQAKARGALAAPGALSPVEDEPEGGALSEVKSC